MSSIRMMRLRSFAVMRDLRVRSAARTSPGQPATPAFRCFSFVPQRGRRVDSGGAAGGEVTGGKSDQAQDRGGGHANLWRERGASQEREHLVALDGHEARERYQQRGDDDAERAAD